MSAFSENILLALNKISGSGTFWATGVKEFVFPGMEVEGIGELSFPLNKIQITELLKVASRAPFGKGSQTILDENVRSTWEIDAAKIRFTNKEWAKLLQNILTEIKPGLGLDDKAIDAHLYKMLIYEEGDFFLAHQDSEKEEGMFGTLIIGLPAKHTGGEFIVCFEDKKESLSFAEATAEYKLPYIAFYADCEHEIKPVTSGYRVCLTYNLVQKKSEEKIKSTPINSHATALAKILKSAENDFDFPKIILLGHQYTPTNFSMSDLKLNDRPKAEALLKAASDVGFYAKLGLVTSFQTGELVGADYNYGRRGYYDDYDDEDGEMGEVYDEEIRIEHWMEEGVPALDGLRVSEERLIRNFELNEGEPEEKESEGYMGNYGPDISYWYHYGAMFLWPKKKHLEVLSVLPAATKLQWLDYYNNKWNTIDDPEKSLAAQIVENSQWQADPYEMKKSKTVDAIAQFFINKNDEQYFKSHVGTILGFHFKNISVPLWISLFDNFGTGNFETFFSKVAAQKDIKNTNRLLEILVEVKKADSTKHHSFLVKQITSLPEYLNDLGLEKAEKAVAKNIVENTLPLSELKNENTGWIENTTKPLTNFLNREYVNEVLVKNIFEKKLDQIPLAKSVLKQCEKDLQQRVDDKPQPPKDWTRAVPEAKSHGFGYDKKVWDILKDFLESPTENIFLYKELQANRKQMEEAIRYVTIDLAMETIRKGSPHTLKLTKTQDAYKGQLQLWETDVRLLDKVKSSINY